MSAPTIYSVFAPSPEPVELSVDSVELIAYETGGTIERDPATGRLRLVTEYGVYVACGGAE